MKRPNAARMKKYAHNHEPSPVTLNDILLLIIENQLTQYELRKELDFIERRWNSFWKR